jgi:hypothetical protein
MANKPANTLSSQQVIDAQLLDDMTSLQQFNIAEQSILFQQSIYLDQSVLYCVEEVEFKSRNQKGWL